MRIPDVGIASLLERGVWKAPWIGLSGGIVLLAVKSNRMLLKEPQEIPPGSDHIAAADQLWDELDQCDPITAEQLDQIRRSRMRKV